MKQEQGAPLRLLTRFDTLDKKPALYNIAVISAAVLAAAVLLLHADAERYAAAVDWILAVYYPAVLVLLVRAYVRQLRYNPYSYNTICYLGFALFVLSVMITHFVVMARRGSGQGGTGVQQIVFLLLGSARRYMQISAPFIALFSAALCCSNISLIRHEGRRFVNILGIILSVLLVAGEAFIFLYDADVTGSLAYVRFRALVGSLFAAGYLYFECMLIGAIAANILVVRYEPEPDKDYLIVLGCGIRKDGTPTPLLKGRLDRAIAFRDRQLEETGKDLVFITSGGQGPDEIIPESTSMKRYLISQGIPAERIIEEECSTDTLENMRFSKEKIAEAGAEGKIAFSTTNYHVFRGGLCARRVKMRALGMGAPTKWYFWPNASVREFVGLLTEHRGKQALIIIGVTAVYTALTLLAYR